MRSKLSFAPSPLCLQLQIIYLLRWISIWLRLNPNITICSKYTNITHKTRTQYPLLAKQHKERERENTWKFTQLRVWVTNKTFKSKSNKKHNTFIITWECVWVRAERIGVYITFCQTQQQNVNGVRIESERCESSMGRLLIKITTLVYFGQTSTLVYTLIQYKVFIRFVRINNEGKKKQYKIWPAERFNVIETIEKRKCEEEEEQKTSSHHDLFVLRGKGICICYSEPNIARKNRIFIILAECVHNRAHWNSRLHLKNEIDNKQHVPFYIYIHCLVRKALNLLSKILFSSHAI